MGRLVILVGSCVALFVLAVGFIVLTQGPEIAALFDAFASEPLLHKLAWIVVMLVPFVLLPAAVWLCDTLVRQRKAADALALRLDGVRQGVREMAKSQVDAEAAVHHLARTDPEDAISAVQHRLTEAERFAQVQQSRNETGDLQSRVDAIRAQQEALQQRLAPALEKRRSIEQLFAELDSRQTDIERTLAEIAHGDDAVHLDIRLKNLIEFVKHGHGRCDEIENASKTITSLTETYSELQGRLAPFAEDENGVTRRVKDLSEARDNLAAELDSLQRTPEGGLAERVQKFTDDKRRLEEGVSQLDSQYAKLGTLRNGIEALFASFDQALDKLAVASGTEGAADADAGVEELKHFIDETQVHIAEIERKTVVFGQLRTKLDDLQSRLAPLESAKGGVVNVIDELQDIRDQLVAKIKRIDEGESGHLATRVKTFAEAKNELEERVAGLTDQFSRLATIRKDISGLFDKLSGAVSASSN
jgi:chromosome segregation ATPase